MSTSLRRVMLAGATGLVGSHLLAALLADASVCEVHVLSRRALPCQHAKLHLHIVDFNALPTLPPVDELYLALGTTIKVAGSQAAFRAVDLEANLAVAKAAIQAGTTRIGIVSAVGASSSSPVFYNRVKGELEDALRALAPQALLIAQPSILLGNRAALKQPFRPGERLAILIARLVSPLLPGRYRPVNAADVARALLQGLPLTTGVVTLSSNTMVDGIHAAGTHKEMAQ
ncbi:NAD-dependent epimerase/dehydratase family protein [Aquitalea denitrificans]|uniref:NAD-dependent epimerase/dehydratase family protein n=1 Tax=Aquitalea denitrificans TaxID=519081 RepID=UPI00135A596C|nr:NAD-dependent epimerase/dehydratase family protein [Aquitalea denitrificans]